MNAYTGFLPGRLPVVWIKVVVVLAFFKCAGHAGPGIAVEWNPGRPDYYRVEPGDTLWGIAGRFLNRPWEWPEVWRGNPQIANPDLIYPGDVIVVEGGRQPYLRLEPGSTYRLSPRVRSTPLEAAIPVIPLKVISPFLTRPTVIETDALDALPYVVEVDEGHVIGGPGDRLLVRAIRQSAPAEYTVFRPGAVYRDPDSDAVLGHEAVFIAEGRLVQTGDPASVIVIRAEKEARAGDRLLPAQAVKISSGYLPHPARKGQSGHIIGVMDGVSQIGQFSVVALDRGRANGVEVGHVFEIWQRGGILMVFLTFRRVSFGLVMKAERFIHVMDLIRAP